MHSLTRVCTILFTTLLAVSAAGQTKSSYAWKTFAGQPGGAGGADGIGDKARFYFPYGVAKDAAGNLFVADTYNNTIRKMTSDGVVTTLAGSAGKSGSADGTKSAARFSSPRGVAVDSAGNVYVTDSDNNTIRKVTADGVVTTLAGSPGQVGGADGTNDTARFNQPHGIAVDNAGNLYVADAGNSTLRRISSNGVVTTLAGSAGLNGSDDGTNSAARFFYPVGVAVDNTGHIYVADQDNSTIRKVTSAGLVTTFAGAAEVYGHADGTNETAEFFYPSSLGVDNAGNVFVADTFNATIRKITAEGVVTTIAGSAEEIGSDDGTNDTARFNYPSGIAVDATGNLYVADTDNCTIRKVTSEGVVTTLAGSLEQSGSVDADGSVARFHSPFGVTVDPAGNAYITDTFNHTIRKASSSSLVTTLAGNSGEFGNANGSGNEARFNTPYAIAFSAGDCYVADSLNHVIRKVTTGGVVTTLAGSPGQSGSSDGTNGTARFASPFGIAADGAGNLYVADFLNRLIRKITSAGVVTTLAGSAGQAGSADGTNDTARFNGPFGVAADGAGNVYVTDSAGHTVRKITSAGVVTTLAGSPGQSGGNDGTNQTARFNVPTGIAVDADGNLYVADIGSSTIRKVTAAGIVTTVAGSPGLPGSRDGVGSAARFLSPAGIAMDHTGNLLVADSGNHSLRRVTTNGVVTTFAGKAGEVGNEDVVIATARFFSPSAVAMGTGGKLYVADTYNQTIRILWRDGAVSTLAGLAGSPGSANGAGSVARFNDPFGVAADNAGNVFVADSYNSTIRKVTSDGVVTTFAGSAGQPGSADGTGSTARFYYPSGIAVDSQGNVYVADHDDSTVRKITSAGEVTTLAGSAGFPGSADGEGAAAQFEFPNGIAVDYAGNLFVADSGNSTIRKVTSAGVVTTFAGSAGQVGSADGIGSAARFDYPFGLAVDGAGNVFVADAGNSTIRKITSDGVVTTIGGFAGVFGGENGIGSEAGFAWPTGIAVDSNGRLYVADSGNNRISRGIPLPNLTIAAAGSGVRLSWPSAFSEFLLQQASNTGDPNGWMISPHSYTDNGTNKVVMIPSPIGNQFFRLVVDE